MADSGTKQGGSLLAEWRSGVGKSQTECAAGVGVRQATWSEWESGAKNPQIKYAIRIERMTGGAVPVTCWEPEEPGGAPASTAFPAPSAGNGPISGAA